MSLSSDRETRLRRVITGRDIYGYLVTRGQNIVIFHISQHPA